MKNNIKGKLALVIIIITWMVVGLVIIWHLIALLWVLIFSLTSRRLYIPESIRITIYSILAVLAWAIIVYLLCIAWVAYNKLLIAKKGQTINKSNCLVYIEKEMPWSEALISKVDSQSILEEVEKIKKSLIIINLCKPLSNPHLDIREPQKLLNISVALIKKGQLLNGISILRIILEHPGSSPLVKKIAGIKLAQCLYELGYRNVASGLAEKVI